MRIWLILIIVVGLWQGGGGVAALAAAEGEHGAPQAVRGIIDLRDTDLAQDVVTLDGEWERYWNQLAEPEQIRQGAASNPSYVQVPDNWSGNSPEANESSIYGYATYRLQIQLNEQDAGKMKAVYMPSVATAYELWIDGRQAAANGEVGRSGSEMKPKVYAKVVPFVPNGDRVELVVKVSNFVQYKGGLWESIRFGDFGQVSYQRDSSVFMQLFISGSLFIMGFYHLILYAIRRKERSIAYFGGLCLLMCLRNLLVGETFLVSHFPDIPWEAAVKMEYLTNSLSVPLFTWFVYKLYPKDMLQHVPLIVSMVCAAYSLFVLFTPAVVYTKTMFSYQVHILVVLAYIVYVFAVAVIRRRKGSLVNLAAMVFFFLATLNEVLYYNGVSSLWLGGTASVGLFIYLLAQSVVLSMRFSDAIFQQEKLALELESLNMSLEKKIAERTESLERMDRSRRMLLSNISHELRTPLTSIQGYIKAMIDGVIPPDDKKFTTTVYQKTQYLNRIIEDLSELSKMEAKQVTFRLRDVPIVPFMRQLFEKYELEMEQAGIQFQFDVMADSENELSCKARIDTIRMEQVFSNLLVNAKRFTPEGKTISIRLEVSEAAGHVIITVSDTGIGIPEDELPHVFERFFRGAASRRAERTGAGLGLAIAKEIVEYHGGKLTVRSEQGEGTVCTIELPILPEEDISSAQGKFNLI